MAGTDMMQLVQRALRKWFPHIERMTRAQVELVPGEEGRFTILASWPATAAGPEGRHQVVFSRERVLGHTATSPVLRQKPVKKICLFRDDIIREVLEARK